MIIILVMVLARFGVFHRYFDGAPVVRQDVLVPFHQHDCEVDADDFVEQVSQFFVKVKDLAIMKIVITDSFAGSFHPLPSQCLHCETRVSLVIL